jgi:H+-transporting ATPase
MITGDQLEIAQEMGRRLGIGDSMYVYDNVMKSLTNQDLMKKEIELNKIVLDADGFANVFPEHKYEIVRRLQDLDYMVAMTGKF